MFFVMSGMRRRAAERSAGVRGFTLIELLVVVAIIALLIAILIPSLRSARERAKGTVCLTNLRALTMASFTYAQENNNCMYINGGTFSEGDNGLFQEYWCYGIQGTKGDVRFGALSKYFNGNPKLELCPATSSDVLPYAYSSYTVQPPVVTYAGIKGIEGQKMQAITRPSETVMFMDSATLPFGKNEIQGVIDYSPVSGISPFSAPPLAARHARKGNVAWVSGEAATMDAFLTTDPAAVSATNAGRVGSIPLGYLLPTMPTNVAGLTSMTAMQFNYYYFADKDAGQ